MGSDLWRFKLWKDSGMKMKVSDLSGRDKEAYWVSGTLRTECSRPGNVRINVDVYEYEVRTQNKDKYLNQVPKFLRWYVCV